MNIVDNAKYLLTGLFALCNREGINIVICQSYQAMLQEKNKFENENIDAISYKYHVNKTYFIDNGMILWKNKNEDLRGYNPSVIIFVDADKQSESYKMAYSLYKANGSKIYSI